MLTRVGPSPSGSTRISLRTRTRGAPGSYFFLFRRRSWRSVLIRFTGWLVRAATTRRIAFLVQADRQFQDLLRTSATDRVQRQDPCRDFVAVGR